MFHGNLHSALFQQPHKLLIASILLIGGSLIDLVRSCKMREHSLDLKAVKSGDACRFIRALFRRRKTDTAHSGIQRQMDGSNDPCLPCCLIDLLCHGVFEYSRSHFISDNGIVILRECESQKQDRFADSRFTKFHALFHSRDCESPQIIICFYGLGDPYRSMSIAISLDDSDHLNTLRKVRFHIPEVFPDRTQIDLCIYSCMLHDISPSSISKQYDVRISD